jgi:hypothetical protein
MVTDNFGALSNGGTTEEAVEGKITSKASEATETVTHTDARAVGAL